MRKLLYILLLITSSIPAMAQYETDTSKINKFMMIDASNPSQLRLVSKTTFNTWMQGYMLKLLYAAPVNITSTSTVVPTMAVVNTYTVDATAGNVILTINNSNVMNGQIFNIKRTDATTNTVTIKGSSGTIDGGATYIQPVIFNFNSQVQVNGANLIVI